MFKIIFVLAVGVVGIIEWLKNLLPSKVTENKTVLTITSGVVSAVTGVVYAMLFTEKTSADFLIYGAGTVGIVQVCYTTLLQTFKAVVTKLKNKYTTSSLDSDKLSDEITEKIETTVKEVIEKSVSK